MFVSKQTTPINFSSARHWRDENHVKRALLTSHALQLVFMQHDELEVLQHKPVVMFFGAKVCRGM